MRFRLVSSHDSTIAAHADTPGYQLLRRYQEAPEYVAKNTEMRQRLASLLGVLHIDIFPQLAEMLDARELQKQQQEAYCTEYHKSSALDMFTIKLFMLRT